MKQATGIWLLAMMGALVAGCSGEQGGGEQAGEAGASASTAGHAGEAIYDNYCFSCHNTGLSGAPILGDVEAWAPRIAKGPELLLQTTIEGIAPAMPPRGLCFDCSDEDLAAARFAGNWRILPVGPDRPLS